LLFEETFHDSTTPWAIGQIAQIMTAVESEFLL